MEFFDLAIVDIGFVNLDNGFYFPLVCFANIGTVRLERFQDSFFLGGMTYIYDISNER